MNFFSKNTKLKIIVNFFLFILAYYFCFNIYPSLNADTKINYQKIETNSDLFFSSVWIAKRSSVNRQEYIEFKKNEFLTKYIDYLNSKPDIKTKAPCPSELIKNNLRNIQMYPNLFDDPILKNYQFNVRFNLSKFYLYSQNDLSKLDKCFNFFFVEQLNNYFIIYRQNLIDELKIEYDYKLFMGYNYPDNFTFDQFIKVNEFINNVKFFVNPNTNYTHSVNLHTNITLNQIFLFLACLLIISILNFSYYKLGKKKLSKIINEFINR
jgi:hypothetical protein